MLANAQAAQLKMPQLQPQQPVQMMNNQMQVPMMNQSAMVGGMPNIFYQQQLMQ
jgi:hypothetical protein